MSEFIQQILNEREHRRKLIDAMNRADIEKWKELARVMKEGFTYPEPDLIPCTEELTLLKEFLASNSDSEKHRWRRWFTPTEY